MLNNIKNGDKVWAILNDEEKASLSLQLLQNKSTWQAGEILKKSHYKYLEIYSRAKEFVRLFTIHFKKYDNLVPKGVRITPELKEYFEEAILNRKSIRAASEDLSQKHWKAKVRNKALIEHYRKWINSEYEVDQDFLNLILHFDKWNNFRILPKDMQEPHAFKRRNKNRYKQHINLHLNMSQYSLDRFEVKVIKGKDLQPGVLYTPIIKNFKEQKYIIKEVHHNMRNLNLINDLYLYAFRTPEEAKEYVTHIFTFDLSTRNKKPKEGLDFWPKYRALIRLSINYDAQQGIITTRKYYDLMQQDDLELKATLKLKSELNSNNSNN
jgi:hypothetical protein